MILEQVRQAPANPITEEHVRSTTCCSLLADIIDEGEPVDTVAIAIRPNLIDPADIYAALAS